LNPPSIRHREERKRHDALDDRKAECRDRPSGLSVALQTCVSDRSKDLSLHAV